MTILPVETSIPIPYKKIESFCEKHHIMRLWLFGSVLRSDFSAESDVDILVEFDPSYVPGWEFYGSWTEELSTILGHSVDLSTPDSLRSWVKPHIMACARIIYERTE